MTDQKFFIQTIVDEIPRFERVFKALPDNLEDLRHHPKNKNAMELIRNTMVYEAATFPIFLNTGSIDFEKVPMPKEKTVSKLAVVFKSFLEETHKIARKMSEVDWNSKAVMLSGDKVDWETTKGGMAWGLILDLIHHRGQLSTYIRPHGGKVPSIYGPSGDTSG